MDEGLRITNEKRRKSSSSILGVLDGVRSERKFDFKGNIPEVDDQFAIAEGKCNDLQQKINLIKSHRRRKKLKKRSTTTVAEPGTNPRDIPIIAVRTQPKTPVERQGAQIGKQTQAYEVSCGDDASSDGEPYDRHTDKYSEQTSRKYSDKQTKSNENGQKYILKEIYSQKVGDCPTTWSYKEEAAGPFESVPLRARRVKGIISKLNNRHYETPTISSRMKNAGTTQCQNSKRATIPFIVSKSTTPSHNIGVNIQQILNGLKMQQPLSMIPLTLAHRMGLRHMPTATIRAESAKTEPMLRSTEINVLKLGQHMLPSYKYTSYKRLLDLYQEGDGVVPKYLRAARRLNYVDLPIST